jgi:hypothetical protein
MVSDCGVRDRAVGQLNRGLPEFRVEILEWNRSFNLAAAELVMIAGNKERLPDFGVKAETKNEFHELLAGYIKLLPKPSQVYRP